MSAIGFISVFSFFLAFAVLAWLGLLLWRLLGNARRKPLTPQCARCGYSTLRLSTPRCPECGADFLRDGVLTPSMRVRGGGGVFLAIAAWTLTTTAITLFLASWVAFVRPLSEEFRSIQTAEPISAQYRSVAIQGEARSEYRFYGTPLAQQLTAAEIVVTANDGATHDLRLRRERPGAPFQLESGELFDPYLGRAPIDVVQEFLVRAGAASEDPATRAEAAELANVINGSSLWGFVSSLQSGAFINSTNTTSSKPGSVIGDTLSPLLPTGICVVGLGVWIAGLVIMVNQHAKRYRARPAITEPYGDPLPPSDGADRAFARAPDAADPAS